MELTQDTSIQFLIGVGERRAALYHKLRILTVRDLLYHFPRDYVDLSVPYDIMSAPLMQVCAVKARLIEKQREQRIRAKLSIFKLIAGDDTGELFITMFNCGWTIDGLKPDEEYIFYGKVTGNLIKREMTSPDIYPVPKEHMVLPVYPQTAGINSKFMRQNLEQCLAGCKLGEDPLPEGIRKDYNLESYETAIRNIHFPPTLEKANAARQRFIFEELLVLSLGLSMLHADNAKKKIEPMEPVNLGEFYTSLPFAPTSAQLRCIDEAVSDMQSPHPMNRLVQGDVGSGKTLVAAACIWFAYKNNCQSAVMVPTEILAEQHYHTISAFLRPFGTKVALLTGSTLPKEKKLIYSRIASGDIDCCIGTHALLSEGVSFLNLGLVVTDEQHRFGVAQRAKLSQKSESAHVLVMSATPIPRTLSLIIYGDLKLSVIDELPPGRKPVDTLLIGSSKRARAIGFIKDALDKGRQAYIVCPLIEQGEVETELKPAVEYARQLAENELSGYSVGLLHGKMKPKEKENVMRRFTLGEIQVLVSTTVVEVGVDVPNATIILIENAERFGLSQLHQLRGRVGRGENQSWCILVSDSKGDGTRERLAVMKKTSDGFKVAEYDLQQRGPGDFFGLRQHGLPTLKVANLADDITAMQAAGDCAKAILEADPALAELEHLQLKNAVQLMLQSVGERPN